MGPISRRVLLVVFLLLESSSLTLRFLYTCFRCKSHSVLYVSEIVLHCFIDSFSIGVGGFKVEGVRFVNWLCFSEVYSIYELGGLNDSYITGVTKASVPESNLWVGAESVYRSPSTLD